MPLSIVSAFLVFTFITAFTPGPNSILALSVGVNYGFRKSIPILAGICSGFSCIMLICCVLVYSISSLSEQFIIFMKYIGCIYIIWLSWKIATTKSNRGEDINTRVTFINGFILQFLNIKIIIYGMTAYSGFILPYYNTILPLFASICILTLIGSAGTVSWAFAGSILQKFFHYHAKIINFIMAGMLLNSIIPLVFD